ncbi:methionine--tRNA ligase, mitochondrial [Elysia marginata]|uniref:Methionine--tRNA ligase, mitochondrial n=1 Tax=Elysia marginata TaxID=1093978 RepID=A0AAV4HA33_9GAST|nr:methionine--tRNA ligase, mitochondrial [Elysia marginata]
MFLRSYPRKHFRWPATLTVKKFLRRVFLQSHQTRTYSNSDPYFITTPIFYVNAAPHLGHLYCCLLADASARWQQLKGRSTFFTTGTDEHGLKIQQAAAANNQVPSAFCDEVSQHFKTLFDSANIKYDAFQRTTDQKHVEAVQAFWKRLESAGHIYQGSYAGWYSVPDEAFLTNEDVEEKILADGSTKLVSKESGHAVIWTEEKNYMFKLSDFQQDLLYWLNSHPIQPTQLEPQVRHMVQTLPDLSVTRDRERLSWGIPVPGDPSQTIYVWLDALINYISALGYPHRDISPWPPDCQIVGKDILRFHAVYWPAFLIAAGLEPPPKLVVHSHWLVDNVKMSKSLGNVVDPQDKMREFGVDGFRYFLLKEGSLSSDCSYSDRRLAERINTDLANTLGNLLGRSTAPSVNRIQGLPPMSEEGLFEFMTQEEREIHQTLYCLPDRVDHLIQQFHFSKALDLVMSQLHWGNAFVQAHEPWVLSKAVASGQSTGDNSQGNEEAQAAQIHLDTVLHVAMEMLRVSGIILQAVVPDLSDRLLTRLGVPKAQRTFSHAQKPCTEGHKGLGDKIVLYKKVNIAS